MLRTIWYYIRTLFTPFGRATRKIGKTRYPWLRAAKTRAKLEKKTGFYHEVYYCLNCGCYHIVPNWTAGKVQLAPVAFAVSQAPRWKKDRIYALLRNEMRPGGRTG